MTTISIELSDEVMQKLKVRAEELRVPPSQLAALQLSESLNTPTQNVEQWRTLAQRVIAEDDELLRRLA